jgi:glycine/sarcosine N-methyltransferase
MDAADPAAFYDSLAGDYHLMFGDWWASALRQGEILGGLLRRHGVGPPASVLDCTCGIGTQTLPLALQGYRVAGSDASERAVHRARAEARSRGIDIRVTTADVRHVAEVVAQRFDAVISADNSLPHLLTDASLGLALVAIRRCLDPGGLFLASIRDYDALVRDGVSGVVPTEYQQDGDRRIVGQAWTWASDRRTVRITVFILKQVGSGWTADVRSTTYRALQRAEMTEALASSGFVDVRWLDPDGTGYYQPIVTARAG